MFFLSYSIQSVFYFFLSHCLFLSDKEQSTAEKESSEKEKKESPEKKKSDNETKKEQSEKSLNTKPEEQEIGDEEQQDGEDADSNQPARNIDAVEILFDLEAAELLPVVIKYV